MRRDAGSVKPRCEGFPAPPIAASTVTPRYGTTVAAAWGPSAPVAHHLRDLAGSSRRPAGHRGDPDPAAGRAPARRRAPKPVWLWYRAPVPRRPIARLEEPPSDATPRRGKTTKRDFAFTARHEGAGGS